MCLLLLVTSLGEFSQKKYAHHRFIKNEITGHSCFITHICRSYLTIEIILLLIRVLVEQFSGEG